MFKVGIEKMVEAFPPIVFRRIKGLNLFSSFCLRNFVDWVLPILHDVGDPRPPQVDSYYIRVDSRISRMIGGLSLGSDLGPLHVVCPADSHPPAGPSAIIGMTAHMASTDTNIRESLE
jgi:hypothetical protein